MARFWRRSSSGSEWTRFKSLQLQSRASSVRFEDERYLLTSTYFMTVELYCLRRDTLLFQYIGHTCSISCMAMSTPLALIVTGSADNTLKFWSMRVNERAMLDATAHRLLVASVANVIWPVCVQIMPFESSGHRRRRDHLVVALCANGFVFVNYVRVRSATLSDDDDDDDGDYNENEVGQWTLEICTRLRCVASLWDADISGVGGGDDEVALITSRSYASLNNNNNLLSVFAVTTAPVRSADYSRHTRTPKSVLVKRWRIHLSVEAEEEKEEGELKLEPCPDEAETNARFDFVNNNNNNNNTNGTSSNGSPPTRRLFAASLSGRVNTVVLAFGFK